MSAPESLIEQVRAKARQEPEAELFVGRNGHRTWAEFDRRTNRLAQALRRLGLGKGERAGILAANCPEWMEVFFAVHKAGGVAVPLNERLTSGERQRLLDDAGVSVLVGEPELLAATAFSGPTLALGPTYESRLTGERDEVIDAVTQLDELAVIAYTSGTTGTPKGVMWSHRALFWSAQFNPFPAAVAGGRRILVCAPLYAGGAILMACNALAIGATTIIERFTPEGTLRTLAEERIEFTGLVPTMIALLTDAAPLGWRAPCLRRIYYGAGTMSAQLFTRARQLFGCEFQQCYGMTETCIAGTRLEPAEHSPDALGRLASAGKPMPEVELKVVDQDGAELPSGSAGEVVIRSPGNMLGYWRRPEQNRDAFRDGWHRTRDIGWLDADGYLYLVDRKDDMVKSGGLNVSPAEVEEILTAHPAVAEAAVIGLPDERWGERVAAIVRTRSGEALTEQELTAFCRAQLADYKTPRTVIFTDMLLPRTGLGKLSRRILRTQYGSRTPGRE
ncbi:MAG: class I adenylate-forming enzyme family protein [Candidatus Binatia bacterium]